MRRVLIEYVVPRARSGHRIACPLPWHVALNATRRDVLEYAEWLEIARWLQARGWNHYETRCRENWRHPSLISCYAVGLRRAVQMEAMRDAGRALCALPIGELPALERWLRCSPYSLAAGEVPQFQWWHVARCLVRMFGTACIRPPALPTRAPDAFNLQ